MVRTKEDIVQLDAEIVRCIKVNDELTGYAVVKLIEAPAMTIRLRLKTMVKNGILDCREDRRAKVYSVPKTVKELPDTRTSIAPKMVSRGPKKARSC